MRHLSFKGGDHFADLRFDHRIRVVLAPSMGPFADPFQKRFRTGRGANDPTVKIEEICSNDHYPGKGNRREIMAGQDWFPIGRDGKEEFVFIGRQGRGADTLRMTTADASSLGGGAGQEWRTTDQAGCLFLGRPVVVHGGNMAQECGEGGTNQGEARSIILGIGQSFEVGVLIAGETTTFLDFIQQFYVQSTMSKPPSVQIGVVNIACHPHSGPKTYVQLFKDLYALNRSVKLRGNEWAKIGSMFEVAEGKPEKGYQGYIYRFTHIDPDGDWLNELEGRIVAAEEAKKEVTIPSHMKPNLRLIRYVFFPGAHRIAFAANFKKASLAPDLMAKLLQHLTNSKDINNATRSVDITVEQSTTTLDYIMKEMFLEKLTITIKRPNPDDDGEEEADTEAVLEEQNARKQIVGLVAIPKRQLKPNKQNKLLARIAISNGSLHAKGLNREGKKEEVDSSDFPLLERDVIPPGVQFVEWFLSFAKKVVAKAVSK